MLDVLTIDLNEVTLASLLPAALYLAVVTVLVLVVRRCPWWTHPLALAAGLPVQAMQGGIAETALSVAVAAGFGFVGVLVTSRLLSGVSLFTLVTTLALLPPAGMWALLVGLGLAALVGTWRTARAYGFDRVQALTVQTASAMGVTPGAFSRPDLGLLHQREADGDAVADRSTGEDSARRTRMYLPPYLLAGVLISATLTTLGVWA